MTNDQRLAAAPPRPLSEPDARLWATFTHLSALIGIVVGAGFIGWLGPLIIFLVLKDRSAFVAEHATTTLNFQITMFIAAVVGAALWIFGIGLADHGGGLRPRDRASRSSPPWRPTAAGGTSTRSPSGSSA